ncbi:MAG: sarcosine oxidase subunit gamma [Albidovulum sp.]|uniref:sarcosine oxidase subunit gamma n=1 Tax=Albidovulum sp. TaxID=1872424 RepID=UPI003CBE017D
MPDFQLTAEPPLAGLDHDYGPVRLAAPAGLAIVSLALPRGGEDAAEKAIKTAYGTALPVPGRYVTAKDGAARLVRSSPDQGLIIFPHPTPDAERVVAAKLKGKVYTTDQTDAWVAVEVSGPATRQVLERICPLDLSTGSFGPDMAKRTVMEHLGVLILRTGEDAFLLLSASSSAKSFLHALATSVTNTL